VAAGLALYQHGKTNMYTSSRKLIIASAITLALSSISGAVVADSLSVDVVEARQESQISTTYMLSPYLRATDIDVTVDDGTATLSGIVEEDVNKQLAQQIALGVSGIKTVDNQILVEADYVPTARTSQERSFYEVVDDATISATVKSKLLWSKNTDGLEIHVNTHMGKVTLQGTAENGAARELAGRMAMNTRGVASVDNQLVIAAPKPKPTVADVDSEHDTSQEIADTWITTKVKSTYMYSSNVENDDISVSTSEGNVTLSGKVSSGAERELATELAQNIRGVKSVDATALTF
jgi:hyperosmotically inducible periplasmic protein